MYGRSLVSSDRTDEGLDRLAQAVSASIDAAQLAPAAYAERLVEPRNRLAQALVGAGRDPGESPELAAADALIPASA